MHPHPPVPAPALPTLSGLALHACLPTYPCLQVFMLSSEAEINSELLTRILQRGHSRLPVYEGQDRQVGAGGVALPEMCCWAGSTVQQGGMPVRP